MRMRAGHRVNIALTVTRRLYRASSDVGVRSLATGTEHSVNVGGAVSEIREQADTHTQTDGHADRNTFDAYTTLK